MDSLIDMVDDNTGLVLAAVVFIATASLVFGVLAALRLHGAVRKRTAGITSGTPDMAEGSAVSLRDTGLQAVQRIIDYATRHYSSVDESNMKVLRNRLVQAGLFDPRAVGFFFVARFVLAIGCGVAFAAMAPLLPDGANSMFWALVGVGGIFGYLLPSLALDRIIARRRDEYRIGFPDFMDLLVVCADAGLAMEAALERVVQGTCGAVARGRKGIDGPFQVPAGYDLKQMMNVLMPDLGSTRGGFVRALPGR